MSTYKTKQAYRKRVCLEAQLAEIQNIQNVLETRKTAVRCTLAIHNFEMAVDMTNEVLEIFIKDVRDDIERMTTYACNQLREFARITDVKLNTAPTQMQQVAECIDETIHELYNRVQDSTDPDYVEKMTDTLFDFRETFML